MATIAMLVGSAIINAVAFSGTNYLFSNLKSNAEAEEERKRHDLALEQLNRDKQKWTEERYEHLDLINETLQKEGHSKKTFSNIDQAMQEYYIVTGQMYDLPQRLKRAPMLSDFYTPSESHKNGELLFVLLGMGVVGIASYELLKK